MLFRSGIMGILLPEQRSATGAVGIVPLIAALAKRRILVSGVIVLPDTLPTDRADSGFFLCTGSANILSIQRNTLLCWVLTAAMIACKGVFGHGVFSSSSFSITSIATHSTAAAAARITPRMSLGFKFSLSLSGYLLSFHRFYTIAVRLKIVVTNCTRIARTNLSRDFNIFVPSFQKNKMVSAEIHTETKNAGMP